MAEPNIKNQQQQNEDQFEKVFHEAAKTADSLEDPTTEYTQHISSLGRHLRTLFGEYEADRREQEDKMIKDLRQWKGEYDPETLKKFHPKRSKAFLSLTRSKVQTVSARESDLLFPANKEKNWGIKPTPIPELNPQTIQDIAFQYEQQTGEPITEELIQREIHKEAEKRSNAMEKEMEDQLSELKYRQIIRQIIKDGNIYGTGILKGPLIKQQVSKRWLPTPDGKSWVAVETKRLYPWCEHVSVWDFYPDMSARTADNMRGCFQRHVMSRQKVWQLAMRDDFESDAIKAYLKVYRDGSAPYKNYEQGLMGMNRAGTEGSGYSETTSAGTSDISTGSPIGNRKGKYELLEYWGFVSTALLKDIGIEVDEERYGLEVAANVWMLGNFVIKAVVSEIEGVQIPYHLYYYEKDDTSIWGEGIPSIMRDAQKLFNASVRAMLDNAAQAAGPIIEANMDLLDANEDPRDLYPFRVFVREGTGMEAAAQAIHVYDVQSHTSEFMNMIQFFMNVSDDITSIPRHLYGETSKIGGAGKTATGLSMLMGAANVTLKDQVKNFDDGITKPFIRALYFWNMEFNPKEHIKGDFSVVARGSTSLIAREVRMENINQFLAMTNNDIDMQYTKRDNILREAIKNLDLDDLDFIKDLNTVKMEQKARQDQMEEDRQFEKELALIKAQSGGHMSKSAMTPGLRPQMESLSPAELQEGKIPEVRSESEGSITTA